MVRLLTAALGGLSLMALAVPQAPAQERVFPAVAHLGEFQVIEFRRYTITPGGQQDFATYFQSYFPEAFEQLGAIALGQFTERGNPASFTWLRGFKNLEGRAIANSAFYYGPLWKEHKATLNALIVDSDNVMLMRPLRPVPVLPAVDPVKERDGAHGVVVAQLFALKSGAAAEAFVQQVDSEFAAYRSAGAREAGVLATLEVSNNFPQLPVRTDGVYVAWIGIVKDEQVLERQLRPAIARAAAAFDRSAMLRGAPELLVLDPANRSRLRWLGD
jgi:hypothetical protein